MLVDVLSPFYWPPLLVAGGFGNQTLASSAIVFDSATDRIAWMGKSPRTDSLTTIYFRTGTVTTGCTLDVRIESLSNGKPSGSLLAANTNVNVVVADGDDDVWKTATLTSPASLSVGDNFAIVFAVASGTPNMNFREVGLTSSPAHGHFPVVLEDPGTGTWGIGSPFSAFVKFNAAGVAPLTALYPAEGNGVVTGYNSTTNPDERAMRFQVPFKCRVAGIRGLPFNVAAGADFTLSLWDENGDTDAEALGQVSFDGNFAVTTTQEGYVDALFASPVTLEPNTTYYIGQRADTANNVSFAHYVTAPGITDAIKAFPGANGETYLATRQWTSGTAGAWTETTTAWPLIHLIIDQIDDGSSSSASGIAISPNLRPGLFKPGTAL